MSDTSIASKKIPTSRQQILSAGINKQAIAENIENVNSRLFTCPSRRILKLDILAKGGAGIIFQQVKTN
jgi:hypothetical protein